MRTSLLLMFTAFIVLLSSCAGTKQEIKEEVGVLKELNSGLKYIDRELGTGEFPQTGDIVSVHYTGTLPDGSKFDSSLDRGEPLSFPLGEGVVIKGWDEGLSTMRKGGKRQLIIPPHLGYGARKTGSIPPNSTLYFEVELVNIRKK
jgi:peptidylprolyl isomerase